MVETRSYTLEDTFEIEDLPPLQPRRSCPSKFLRFLMNDWFMISTITGVIIGFGVGLVLQKMNISYLAKTWLAMPGKLYIRILQLTILPMIIANIITVIANLNSKGNGKMSSITIACLMVCNLLSSLIGLTFALIIKPEEEVPGTNMIGVLSCSVAFGIAVNAVKEKGVVFKDFFSSLGDVVMYLIKKFLSITPVCVMFMVMSSIANVEEDLAKTFGTLALFVGVNFLGQVTHLILMILSAVFFCKNPFRMLRYSLPPYFISFATTSAIISLPQCYESCDKYGMPKSVSRFVLPIAGTMKSDASAIFIVTAVFYTIQDSDIALDFGKIIIVVILATVYVSALPNIPSAGMVVTTTILCSIGVGPEKAMILFAVEFINDRLRSGNIVFSHLYCTAFVYHACEKDIKRQIETEDGENKLEGTNEKKYVEKES
ncbi:hypothetical protein ACTXT7_015057 [Hymenolepis weldensis]